MIPLRHEWLEVIGARYVSALLAALRGEGQRLTGLGWGRALTWQESQGAHSMVGGGHEGSFQNLMLVLSSVCVCVYTCRGRCSTAGTGQESRPRSSTHVAGPGCRRGPTCRAMLAGRDEVYRP